MEIKKFDEYTKEEQKDLLFHWWNYYGKTLVFLNEVQAYQKLLEEDIEFVKNVALISYIQGDQSPLVHVMRANRMDEFKEVVNNFVASECFKGVEAEAEKYFIEEIVGTYNNPQPAEPIQQEQFLEMLVELLGVDAGNVTVVNVSGVDLMSEKDDDKFILTSTKVKDVYESCLLDPKEYENDVPLVDFTVGEGVNYTSIFSTERLEEKKEEIISMVDELIYIEEGTSFLMLCLDKKQRQWTNEHLTIDFLIQLGMGIGVLSMPLDREQWPSLPGGLPLVIRNKEIAKENLRNHKPKEFTKVIDDLKSSKYYKSTVTAEGDTV